MASPLTTVDIIWTVHSAGAGRRNILAAVTFLTVLLHPVVLFQSPSSLTILLRTSALGSLYSYIGGEERGGQRTPPLQSLQPSAQHEGQLTREETERTEVEKLFVRAEASILHHQTQQI